MIVHSFHQNDCLVAVCSKANVGVCCKPSFADEEHATHLWRMHHLCDCLGPSPVSIAIVFAIATPGTMATAP